MYVYAVCTKMENQNLISISKKEKINASRDCKRDREEEREIDATEKNSKAFTF